MNELARKFALAAPSIEDDQWLIRAFDRSFHIALNRQREETTAATPIHLMDQESTLIHADLIAEFNYRNLFEFGDRLAVDRVTGSLFLCATQSLNRLESSSPVRFLEDFVERCVGCALWYAEATLERELRAVSRAFSRASLPADSYAIIRRV